MTIKVTWAQIAMAAALAVAIYKGKPKVTFSKS